MSYMENQAVLADGAVQELSAEEMYLVTGGDRGDSAVAGATAGAALGAGAGGWAGARAGAMIGGELGSFAGPAGTVVGAVGGALIRWWAAEKSMILQQRKTGFGIRHTKSRPQEAILVGPMQKMGPMNWRRSMGSVSIFNFGWRLLLFSALMAVSYWIPRSTAGFPLRFCFLLVTACAGVVMAADGLRSEGLLVSNTSGYVAAIIIVPLLFAVRYLAG